MVILFAGHLAPSVHSEFLSGWLSLNCSKMCCHMHSAGKKCIKQNRHQRMLSFAKKSSFQDDAIIELSPSFNSVDPVSSIRPSRLLPTAEIKTFPSRVPEEIISTVRLDQYDAFYVLDLSTSREFNSSLLDKNAAILVYLIDVDGDSLLQRVPAIYWDQLAQGKKELQLLPFQSGSVDVVTFKGPKLKKIKEIWIGLESGSWRLDGLSLKVIHGPLNMYKDLEGTPQFMFDGLQYTFDKLNVLLGEDEASVAEARPVAVTDLSGISISDLQEAQLSSPSIAELKEDGLREYADLKKSLLLYDIAIVITGFCAFTLVSNDSAAYSFLAGGIGGFLYLLLLQRSVDGLPAISSPSEDGHPEPSVKGFSGVRRSWLILSLFMVAGAVALRYDASGESFELTPTELFVGMAGFLANKAAVLLAAFKPLEAKLEKEDGSRD